VESLASQKRTLRPVLRERFAAVPQEIRAAAEREATRRFVSSVYFASSRVVMLYSPTPGEFDAAPAVLASLAAGHTVALPRVDWPNRRLSAHVISVYPGGLVQGRHGILEPPADAPGLAVEDLDLVVAPGVGFDSSGGRIGRGAGLYDRFLSQPGFMGIVAALAIEAQIVDRLPMREPGTTELPDQRMNVIFTERRVVLGRGNDHAPVFDD